MRHEFLAFVGGVVLLSVVAYFFSPVVLWTWLLIGPIIGLGFFDFFQEKRSILRNFPVIGRLRFFLEAIRPGVYQYFVESDTGGVPFDRDQRSLVYQRAKGERDTVPFGTKMNLYEPGYEWINHSMMPLHHVPEEMRITIGGPGCQLPYNASVLNISAMSFGSLSDNAILALSQGAALGKFAHNTGEGGISRYHRDGGGDLIWQIGTGYFGCRSSDGTFCESLFRDEATDEQVKMIELKLSQGAKP